MGTAKEAKILPRLFGKFCFPKTYDKALLLERPTKPSFEHGEIKLIPSQDEGASQHLSSSTFGTGRYLASNQKRKVNTNPATKPSKYMSNLLASAIAVQKACRNQQANISFELGPSP